MGNLKFVFSVSVYFKLYVYIFLFNLCDNFSQVLSSMHIVLHSVFLYLMLTRKNAVVVEGVFRLKIPLVGTRELL